MPVISADTVLVPVGSLHYHDVGDGTWIVLSPDPPQWVHVDDCGKGVLAACGSGRTFSEVVEEVCSRLGADASNSYDHLCSFVQELSETGILGDGREADRGQVDDLPVRSGAAHTLWIHPTHRCNLTCPHCFRDAGRPTGELSQDEWKRVLGEFRAIGGESVIVSGGEPFAREDLCDIVEYSLQLGLATVVITNGTLLTGDVCTRLAALPQDKLGFQISWDGATPSTVDLIRGDGVFHRIRSNYRALRSAGFRGPVVFSMTVMRPNLHEITAFAEMAAGEKANGVHYPFLTLAGRAVPNRVHLEIPRSAWKTVFSQIAAVAERCTDVQISFSRDPMFLCELSKRKMQHCGAGISAWSVEPDGGVTPCAGLRAPQFVAGNVRQARLADIVGDSVVSRDMRELYELPDDCEDCELRFLCGGGCLVNKTEAGRSASCQDPECEWIKEWLWSQLTEAARRSRRPRG